MMSVNIKLVMDGTTAYGRDSSYFLSQKLKYKIL